MSDTSSIPGVQGASRQSWKEANPRPLLRHVMDTARDPHDRPAVMEAFFELANDAMLRVMQEYWFDLNYNRFVADYPKPGQTAQEHQQEKQKAKQQEEAEVKEHLDKIDEAIKQKAKALLLDMITPIGKPLKACTCRECLEIGGWYAALARKGTPEQLVSELWSEREIRALAPANFE